MSNLLKCCCATKPAFFYYLHPCFQEAPAELVEMGSADFVSCGFGVGSVYRWDTGNPADDPYCGVWRISPISVGDRTDSDCTNYTFNVEGCCGGDCLPDDPCCGFEPCYDWLEANNDDLVDVTGFSGGSGSTTDWAVSVTGVSASAGAWVGGAWVYDVTVSLEITVTGIGNLECDSFSNFTQTGSYTFTITHNKSLGCVTSADSGLTYPSPDCGIRLCDGTTSNPSTSWDDCSKVVPAIGTPTTTTPDLGNDCLTNAAYSLTIPITYSLEPGDLGCADCDTTGGWSGQAFPDISISTTLTLTGTWSP